MIEKIFGYKIGHWSDIGIFIVVHPFAWAIGYFSYEDATAIVCGPLTIGIEY